MLDVEGPPPLLTSAWVLLARDQQLFGCWGWDWTEGSALGALVGDLLDWSVEIDQKVNAEKKTQPSSCWSFAHFVEAISRTTTAIRGASA